MAVPFHRLGVAGDILIAARGASVHTFNAADGSYISSWHVPEEKEAKAEAKAETATPAEGEDAPPSKRRRVEGEIEQSEATDKTDTKKQKKNKDAAKAQASALRTADLPVVSILAVAPDGGRHVVVVLGHDKTVRVLAHDGKGCLKQTSARVVPKRPCDVAFSDDGKTILSGDKFGDVYALPLVEVALTEEQKREAAAARAAAEAALQSSQRRNAEAVVVAPLRLEATELTVHTKGNRQALENQRKQKELFAQQQQQQQKEKENEEERNCRLLLGHVSMLTAVVTANGFTTPDGKRRRPLILTADRDEHIRVTRGVVGNVVTGAGGQTHVIETFCLGHTSFVSRLCVPRDRPDRLVSGGGDNELWVWAFWPEGRLLGKADLASHVGNVVGLSNTKVALSGLYSFSFSSSSSDAMADGDSNADAVVVAICERVPALFFFRMQDTTLAHVQTLRFDGQLPLDVVQAGDRLFVATAAESAETSEANTGVPSTLLAITKDAAGTWTAAPASVLLPAPDAATDAATAALDRATLRQLLLHSTESLRKDSEDKAEGKPEEKAEEKASE